MNRFNKIYRFFQFKHVNHQIFLLMILTITIPLLIISMVIYIYSVSSVKKEYQESSNLILNNLSFNIDQYLQSIEIGTQNAQMDDRLHHALENWSSMKQETIDFQSIQYENSIETFISSLEVTIKNIDSVQIYIGDRVFYSTIYNESDYNVNNLLDKEWYKRTIEQKGKIVLFGTHKPFQRVNTSEKVISVARVINKGGTRDPLGVLLIDIRLNSLREILKLSENSNRNFVILDENGSVVYSSDTSLVTTSMRLKLHSKNLLSFLGREAGNYYTTINGVNSYVNFVTSPYSEWTVIQYIGEKEMTKHADTLRKMILGLAIGSIGTAILFMLILYLRVTKPITYLSNQVILVGKGNFDVNLQSNRHDEFGVLYNGINKMVLDLQVFIERSSVLKAQQKLAQYRALKSQINPHFLANALESIQMKSIINKQRDIAEMIGILGQLFRSCIQTGKETVSLEEELHHIRLYIKVQQMRFGDKIRYIEKLSTYSESVQILHFSLQPLVENGIVHGLEQKGGNGMLEIITLFSGKDLLIKIRDNGVGMDEENVLKIRERLLQPLNTLDKLHIGIKNVHDQIRYYYGDQYGIEIESQLGKGTTVTIRIPYQLQLN